MKGTIRTLFAAVVVVSAVAFGGAAPAPAEAPDPSPERIETFAFPSALVDTATPGGTLTGDRTVPEVHVFLPRGYADNPDTAYPVLWMLHGANTASATSAAWIQEMAPDFPGIVVMPDGGTLGMYTDWWNGGRRGNPAWTTYHLTEVMDHVESTYRIRPGRQWHSLLGISMGGQGALRYAALRPDYFGSVAALSAAMPDTQSLLFQGGLGAIILLGGAPDGVEYSTVWGSPTGAYAEGNSPQALIANLAHTRVFLSSGNGINCPGDPTNGPDALVLDTVTETFINAQQLLFQLDLEAAGIDVTAQTTCGVHTFGVWDRALVDARRWGFFGKADTDPDADWSYRTVQRSGTMWDLDFRFDDPPMSVARFERDGATLTGSGSGSVTLTGPDGCEGAVTLPFEITVADWCPPDEATTTSAPEPAPPDAPEPAPRATGAPERGRLPATGTDPGAPTVAAIVTTVVIAVRLRWQRPSVSASRRKGVT